MIRARLLAATVIAFAVWAAPASASVGPCLPGGGPNGPLCTFWTGKVTFVADGDTIDVDIAGDSRRTARRVRLTVSTRLGGKWVDVGRYLVSEGHALWMPNGVEWAWNRDYADLSRQAAASGLRLWGTRSCGDGPSLDAALTMRVNYDARYNDRFNVNGEWAEIHNDSSAAVRLEQWWFRDSARRRYTFQKDAVVPAGGSVKLHMGYGADTADELHWGLDSPPFENPSHDARATGDGGYLFDPRGNLRLWEIYN